MLQFTSYSKELLIVSDTVTVMGTGGRARAETGAIAQSNRANKEFLCKRWHKTC